LANHALGFSDFARPIHPAGDSFANASGSTAFHHRAGHTALSAGWHVLRIWVLSVKEMSSHFNSSTAMYSQTTSGAAPASRNLDAREYGNGSLRSAHSRALSSLAIRQVCARRACVE
jgi:hypothetical protein